MNLERDYDKLFQYFCKSGQLEVCKLVIQVKPTINISANNELVFRLACCNGRLEVAKWLLQVKPTIDISAYNEEAFRWACLNGHLEVAKWLLQVKPTIDIFAYNEDAFRWACLNGHLEVAKWLQNLCPEKYQIMQKIPKIFYKIIKIKTLNNCDVCDKTKCKVKPLCNQLSCEPCLKTWLENNNSYPCY